MHPEPMRITKTLFLFLFLFKLAGAEPTKVEPDLFKLADDNLEITVWASSPMFGNPTNMDIDAQGRIWVAEGMNYRNFKGRDGKAGKNADSPEREGGDQIVVLEDTNGDGKADSSHVFVQEAGFAAPLGIAVIDNKIIVSQPPDLIVYTDVDRNARFDPKIDKREVLLTGFGGKDHDHSLHSVTVGPNGQWYFNHGNMGSNVTDKEGWNLKAGSAYQMKTIAGHPSSDGHVYVGGVALRMNPDGTGLRPIGHNFRNSYEQTVTSFGDVFQNDNDDPPACRVTWLMEYGNAGFSSNDGKRSWKTDQRIGQDTPTAEWRQEDPGSMPPGDVYGGGSPTGIVYYELGALGEKYRGLLLSCEPGRNTIFGYFPKPDGGGFQLERFIFLTTNPTKDFAGSDFIIRSKSADDAKIHHLFRPSDISVGPDGAIYIADWFDARVGGHSTRDKTRSGTIYRIAPKGKKLTVPKFDMSSLKGQIAAFKNPAVNVRGTAFYYLKKRGVRAVSSVKALLYDPNPYIQARATFLLAQLGRKGIAVVEPRLKHRDPQMRIAAFRALRYVDSNVLKHAARLARDDNAGVRREAALALRDISYVVCGDILEDIAKGYDGVDRSYLEAFGTACSGKETEMYERLKKSFKPGSPLKWDDRFTNIAWRLHPLTSITAMKQRALATSLPYAKRKQAMVAIGVQSHRRAAVAMAEIAKNSEGETKAQAMEWVNKRSNNAWKDFDPKAMVSGQKTEKIPYQDSIVPTVMGTPSTLPSLKKILALKPDAARGKMLAARCIMCHRINGQGVEFGPTLTGIGKIQSRENIATAIVTPSADLAHGFIGEEVKTKNGKTLQGFISAEGDPILLRTFGGAEVAIDANDIAGRTKLKKSLMISAENMGLSAQDVRDIVEYLKIQ